MRQRRWLRLLAILAGFTLLVAACSDDDGDSTDDTIADDPVVEPIRIGLVYDAGSPSASGFNTLAMEGLLRAEEELDVETQAFEPAPDGSDREDLLRILADDGYDMVIGIGSGIAPSVGSVAGEYPEITFALVDGSLAEAPNLTSYVFAEEQGSYLVGAAAALASGSGSLGFIGGTQDELTQRYEAGFAAGAQRVDPDASVAVGYLTPSTGPAGEDEPATVTEIASGQIGNGADVIYAAGVPVEEVLAGAGEAEGGGEPLVIGADADAYASVDPAMQGSILTSMVKQVDAAVFEAIRSYVEGTLTSGEVRLDLAAEALTFSTTGNLLTSDVVIQVQTLAQQVASTEIQVPTTP